MGSCSDRVCSASRLRSCCLGIPAARLAPRSLCLITCPLWSPRRRLCPPTPSQRPRPPSPTSRRCTPRPCYCVIIDPYNTWEELELQQHSSASLINYIPLPE